MQYQPRYPYATTSQQYGGRSHTREEQRRRQQEYSQALAEQVAQREQQKQRERELDRQGARRVIPGGSSQQLPPRGIQGFGPPEPSGPVERGLFDGLGHNDQHRSRSNFARGQQQPPQNQSPPNGMPPLVFQPGLQQMQSFNKAQGFQSPTNYQPTGPGQPTQSNYRPPIGVNDRQQAWQEPSQSRGDFSHGVEAPRCIAEPPTQPVGSFPATHQDQQPWTSQVQPNYSVADPSSMPGHNGAYHSSHPGMQQQQPFQSAPQFDQGFQHSTQLHHSGQQQRADVFNGGGGSLDAEEAERRRRKLQQQQEMQNALQRQIEEKRQQKLEAKRRQDEEDRREMERFAEDQRRQRAEQERLQAEKRHKAELEQQKTEQLASWTVTAQQQAKAEHHQKLHAQKGQQQQWQQFQAPPPQFQPPLQSQPQLQPFSQHHFQPQLQPHLQPRGQFPANVESFPSLPSHNKQKNPFTNSRAHLFEDPPPQQRPAQTYLSPDNPHSHPNQYEAPARQAPQGFSSADNNAPLTSGTTPINSSQLLRQYDDMREELRRQKQLVDQLQNAQAEIRQQKEREQAASSQNEGPTLTDLEQLRNDLREELEYREQIHRQELASLKKQQLQQQQRGSGQHCAVQQRLDSSLQASTAQVGVPTSVKFSLPHSSSVDRSLPHQPQHRELQDSHAQLSPIESDRNFRSSVASTGESTTSLLGESKLIYFDGRVSELSPVTIEEERLGTETIDGSHGKLLDSATVKEISRSPDKRGKHPHQGLSSKQSPARRKPISVPSNQEDDDTTDFFIKGLNSPLHKRSIKASRSSPVLVSGNLRYSQPPLELSESSSNRLQHGSNWRLASLGTSVDRRDSDDEDELDTSLNGEQLEALFQRNVRRHEILIGFQAQGQAQVQSPNKAQGLGARNNGRPRTKMAWEELHQQLKSNLQATAFTGKLNCSTSSGSSNPAGTVQCGPEDDLDGEAALVASSRWMPSSIF